ncbi:MAG TPA: ribosome maturation factor RimM [Anaerolineales bacterium]|nr:ribosome maturation factor RimM [Anaerolineales bacterium]
MSARRTKQELVAGRILRPHGVRGMVVLHPESDLVDRLVPGMTIYVGEDRTPRTVRRFQAHGRRYLLELEGGDAREDAERLRDAIVRVRVDDIGGLPPNTFFRWQIVGLRVVEENGTLVGTVVEVLETGANDVYEVERPDGRRVLLPAVRSVIREVDLDAGELTVYLLPGLDELQAPRRERK